MISSSLLCLCVYTSLASQTSPLLFKQMGGEFGFIPKEPVQIIKFNELS